MLHKLYKLLLLYIYIYSPLRKFAYRPSMTFSRMFPWGGGRGGGSDGIASGARHEEGRQDGGMILLTELINREVPGVTLAGRYPGKILEKIMIF